MTNDFDIIQVHNRNIVIKGVGKSFFQDGFPISISISKFKEFGFEVSIFHLIDELRENGWNAETIFNKLKDELDLDIDKTMNEFNWHHIEQYCNFGECGTYEKGGYEKQRNMVFDYLFPSIRKQKHF